MFIGTELDITAFGNKISHQLLSNNQISALQLLVEFDFKFAPAESGIDERGFDFELPNRLYLFGDKAAFDITTRDDQRWKEIFAAILDTFGNVQVEVRPVFRPGQSLHQPWKDEAIRLLHQI